VIRSDLDFFARSDFESLDPIRIRSSGPDQIQSIFPKMVTVIEKILTFEVKNCGSILVKDIASKSGVPSKWPRKWKFYPTKISNKTFFPESFCFNLILMFARSFISKKLL
jgi:hypothetical protein